MSSTDPVADAAEQVGPHIGEKRTTLIGENGQWRRHRAEVWTGTVWVPESMWRQVEFYDGPECTHDHSPAAPGPDRALELLREWVEIEDYEPEMPFAWYRDAVKDRLAAWKRNVRALVKDADRG